MHKEESRSKSKEQEQGRMMVQIHILQGHPSHPMQERIVLVLVLALCFFAAFGSGASRLAAEEVEALQEISNALGKTGWNFDVDPCSKESSWVNATTTEVFENNFTCNCLIPNTTVCHVEIIRLKGRNLEGVLPLGLVKLRYLQEIDLTRNFLSGTIPKEWGAMPRVEIISLLGNNLSGEIPKEIGNITTLRELVLEANNFSGSLPHQLGDLVNLERILLSSNAFSGALPGTFAKLTNLMDFRISGNRFSGKIPEFIQYWRRLEKLVIQGSGLQGPIPSGITLLGNLTDLRISDINGTTPAFPSLEKMNKMKTLILRNCNLTGTIPSYIGNMKISTALDLSFNKLVGPIPETFNDLVKYADFIYLTSNFLNGVVPDQMLKRGKNIDLSYNNFTLKISEPCQQNANLFGSSPTVDNPSGAVPCLKNFHCPKSLHSLHINCGGKEVPINGSTTFEEDQDGGSAAKFVLSRYNWVFSSTGNFFDDKKPTDEYIARINKSILSMPDFELYTEARLSPLSLTYYGLCLRNGNYTVKLHFAEIMFTNDRTYSSLGRRIFDVYIQGKLALKDFNIEDAAGGTYKKVVKDFPAVVVKNNTLEIRFYWAGKGTQSIPERGTYGPLISAISVDPEFKVGGSNISVGGVVGIVAAVLCAMFLIIYILWWKYCIARKRAMYEDLRRLDLQTGSFTLRQIKAATNNFDAANKIGEGGFGPVYKGLLFDGTIIAVKQLSSKSKQGNREFLNEIGMISALNHPNLVKLYGCCIEGDQLLLVYEYMENNSLARALFGSDDQQLNMDWSTRQRICIGIARGLAYLHEESRLKIVHRDIKATNVLLDKDLNPKISDFGLAKLDEEENTHISTRIAGTLGYMAPEYAMRGYLTDKADVYSFGIVALEIVSGKSNTSCRSKGDGVYLLDWACVLQVRGSLIELVDPKLGSEFNKEEAMGMLTVALLCTNNSPTLRPSMSAVVSMLEGRTAIQKLISDPNLSSDDSRFMALRNHHQQIYSREQSQNQSNYTDGPWTGSSTSAHDLYPVNIDSEYLKDRK